MPIAVPTQTQDNPLQYILYCLHAVRPYTCTWAQSLPIRQGSMSTKSCAKFHHLERQSWKSEANTHITAQSVQHKETLRVIPNRRSAHLWVNPHLADLALSASQYSRMTDCKLFLGIHIPKNVMYKIFQAWKILHILGVKKIINCTPKTCTLLKNKQNIEIAMLRCMEHTPVPPYSCLNLCTGWKANSIWNGMGPLLTGREATSTYRTNFATSQHHTRTIELSPPHTCGCEAYFL